MKLQSVVAVAVLAVVLGAGCVSAVYDPYETCYAGDVCTGAGVSCQSSTLSGSSWSGELCTTSCVSDGDCPQDVSNYNAVCVFYGSGEGQCFLTCPGGSYSCPYGQACFTYVDGYTGDSLDLCTP